MLGLISLEIRELIPEALAICGICLLMIVNAVTVRALTIRHMRKYLPGMRKDEIDDKNAMIRKLQDENRLLTEANNDYYVRMKAFKAVADKVII